MKIVTCVAPVNIAVIKYWGKRDENLILPINDSLSATLSTDYMSATTTIVASSELKADKFMLNGKEEPLDNPRLVNCLQEIRKRANVKPEVLLWKISICSVNNFPTAAGLASSAAGYACLVTALAELYNVNGDISKIARRGSGSACRSIYGGWVRWHKGIQEDGEDSMAVQVAPSTHWPEIRVIILVVNETKKKHSSTSAMKRGTETSELLKYRASAVVPRRIEEISEAIKNKDFHNFARITMQDSNQFHAICLDTYPPCLYMNEISHEIANLVHMYNQFYKTNKVAYTFDAGPNACLYILEKDVDEFLAVINRTFPALDEADNYFKGLPFVRTTISKELETALNVEPNKPGCLKYIIHTKVGGGPKIINNHLLNESGDTI